MPFNRIHISKNTPSQTCHAINEHLHQSLVTTCGVNPDDNFCLICRYADEDRIIHPTFLAKRDPQKTIIIEIALLQGRSDEQKEALYSDVRERLTQIDIDPDNIIMFLIENNGIDWTFSSQGSVKKQLGR